MNAVRLEMFLLLSSILIALGCAQNSSPQLPPSLPDKEAKIKAALEKLDPDDRKLAEEQKYCAVETENRLGRMGTPIKVMVKDQPVFLCCKSCVERAQEDPDKTLATVKRLKAGDEAPQQP